MFFQLDVWVFVFFCFIFESVFMPSRRFKLACLTACQSFCNDVLKKFLEGEGQGKRENPNHPSLPTQGSIS